jgi:ribA/ribD-fused uncharacterized protein
MNYNRYIGKDDQGAVIVIDDFHGDNSWLSNFAPATVILDKLDFRTVEHGYVASKTLDITLRERVQGIIRPGDAKRFGRIITLRHDWDRVKDEIMLSLLRQKFSIREYATKLEATGDMQLIEGNRWHDNYWGVCKCARCSHMPAQNKLGRFIMKIREENRSK